MAPSSVLSRHPFSTDARGAPAARVVPATFALLVWSLWFAGGCAADRSAAEVVRWTFEEDLVIGVAEGPEEYQFGHIADIDVGSAGRIHVLDQQAGEVRVYERSGEYAFTFGRPGRGPGEFSNNIPLGADAIHRGPGGELIIPDRTNNRVSRFSEDGTFLGSFLLRLEEGFPGAVAPLGGGRYALQRTTPTWSGVLRLDSAGVVVDTILAFPDPAPSTVSAIPAGRTPALTHAGIWTILPNGLIAAGFSDRFRIELRTLDGEVLRVITSGEEPAPLTRREQERFLERLLDLWRRCSARAASRRAGSPTNSARGGGSMRCRSTRPPSRRSRRGRRGCSGSSGHSPSTR